MSLEEKFKDPKVTISNRESPATMLMTCTEPPRACVSYRRSPTRPSQPSRIEYIFVLSQIFYISLSRQSYTFFFRVNYPSRAIPPVVIFKVFYNMQRLQLMSTVCQSMGGGMDGSRVNCGESIIYIYLKLSVIITRQRYSSSSSSSFNCVRK